MALHHVLFIFIIFVLWTNIATVQASRGEEMAKEFMSRGDDMNERRTRKYDELVLSTARGFGKRTNGQLKKDFLLEWIAMERMRDRVYPRYVMNNAEMMLE